jgi:hypothetical protein
MAADTSAALPVPRRPPATSIGHCRTHPLAPDPPGHVPPGRSSHLYQPLHIKEK